MKVFVAGATGVAGRRCVKRLIAGGHEVTGVARSELKANTLKGLGAVPVEADLFDPVQVRGVVAGHEAVVNLATKIPPPSRAMLWGAWRENARIRIYVSRNLVDAALCSDVSVYLQESLAFMYPDRGEEWIAEDVPPAPEAYARSVLVAEEQTRRFTESGRAGSVLRFGQFYASDASHSQAAVSSARRGFSPFVGPPGAFFPIVHADDAAAAVVAALHVPPAVYNIVDDEPLTQGELAQVLASALDVKALRFAPAPLMRLGGGKVRMLMRSQRVSNRRFRQAAEWTPRFASAHEGFKAVLQRGLSKT